MNQVRLLVITFNVTNINILFESLVENILNFVSMNFFTTFPPHMLLTYIWTFQP